MQKTKIVLLGIGMLCLGLFVNVKAENLSGKNNYTTQTGNKFNLNRQIDSLYGLIDFGTDSLSKVAFEKAYTGYLNLKAKGLLNPEQAILSVADFSLSANVKRLWIIDLSTKTVLFHTLVAHGQGTGEEFARRFSNRENSHESSLGFYVTGSTYTGHNGYSLKLSGMDKGYNDNAYERAIVIHGADYVSEAFIRGNNRLGRSWGCPAVPAGLAKPIINTIKDGTCFYIYYPDQHYFIASTWLETPQIPGSFLKGQQAAPQQALIAQKESTNPEAEETDQKSQYRYGDVILSVGSRNIE